MKHSKAECPICKGEFAVSVDGTLRRHPRGAPDPCPGTGYLVAGGTEVPLTNGHAHPTAETEAKPLPRLVPGTYRSGEPMLEGGTPIPPGHVAISVIAYVAYDGSNGRPPSEEAALLYEDPGYLFDTLCRVPNEHMRLVMKVPPRAKPVYSDTTSPASDPGATTGATP